MVKIFDHPFFLPGLSQEKGRQLVPGGGQKRPPLARSLESPDTQAKPGPPQGKPPQQAARLALPGVVCPPGPPKTNPCPPKT